MMKTAGPLLRMIAWCVTVSLLSAGCAGYRFGGSLPSSVKTLHIPTFLNKCDEPGVELVATASAIEEFQKDGTLDIADADKADAILEVTITGFELKPVGYSGDQAMQANEYRLMLRSRMVMRDRVSGKVIAERSSVAGQSTFRLMGDFSVAKQSVLPAAAADLGRELVESVVEYW